MDPQDFILLCAIIGIGVIALYLYLWFPHSSDTQDKKTQSAFPTSLIRWLILGAIGYFVFGYLLAIDPFKTQISQFLYGGVTTLKVTGIVMPGMPGAQAINITSTEEKPITITRIVLNGRDGVDSCDQQVSKVLHMGNSASWAMLPGACGDLIVRADIYTDQGKQTWTFGG